MTINIPSEIELRISFDLGPTLKKLITTALSRMENQMTTEEFQTYLDAKILDLADKIKAEHDEVMEAISAGGAASGQVPDDLKAKLDQVFTQIADAVGGVFTPTTPPTT